MSSHSILWNRQFNFTETLIHLLFLLLLRHPHQVIHDHQVFQSLPFPAFAVFSSGIIICHLYLPPLYTNQYNKKTFKSQAPSLCFFSLQLSCNHNLVIGQTGGNAEIRVRIYERASISPYPVIMAEICQFGSVIVAASAGLSSVIGCTCGVTCCRTIT